MCYRNLTLTNASTDSSDHVLIENMKFSTISLRNRTDDFSILTKNMAPSIHRLVHQSMTICGGSRIRTYGPDYSDQLLSRQPLSSTQAYLQIQYPTFYYPVHLYLQWMPTVTSSVYYHGCFLQIFGSL